MFSSLDQYPVLKLLLAMWVVMAVLAVLILCFRFVVGLLLKSIKSWELEKDRNRKALERYDLSKNISYGVQILEYTYDEVGLPNGKYRYNFRVTAKNLDDEIKEGVFYIYGELESPAETFSYLNQPDVYTYHILHPKETKTFDFFEFFQNNERITKIITLEFRLGDWRAVLPRFRFFIRNKISSNFVKKKPKRI